MKNFKLLLLIVSIFTINFAYSQTNTDCPDMAPICTDAVLTFPINANAGSAPVGNDYGCVGTQNNPSWFYFEIGVAGDINMELTSTNDMDFIIWGPFTSLANAQGACGNLGLAPNPIGNVDCGYVGGNVENPDITGASPGEVYVMMITNFTNTSTTFTLTQIGGTGETDCSIVIPPCLSSPGTFNYTKNGSATSAPIALCGGDSFSILSNDDYGLPLDTIAVVDGGDGIFSSMLMFLVYDAVPTAGLAPDLDPAFTNVILPTDSLADFNNATSPIISNPALGCGTYWLVPVAGDDGIGANNGLPGTNDNGLLHWDADGNGCYVLGNAIEVTYSCALTATAAINCTGFSNGVDITLAGGDGDVTLTNSGDGTLSSTSVTPPATVQILGLGNGDSYNVTVTDESGCSQILSGGFSLPQFLDVTLIPATDCSGTSTGTVNVEGNNGSGNGGLNSIVINGTIDNTPPLASGDYPPGTLVTIVLVDNAGCTSDSTVTIPSGLHTIDVDIITVTHESCNGASDGSASITAVGKDGNGVPDGIAINSILWTAPSGVTFPGNATNTSLTGMMAGNWEVTVTDASSCTSTIQIVINSASSLDIALSLNSPQCFGDANGSITANINGGTAPFDIVINSNDAIPHQYQNITGTTTLNSIPIGEYWGYVTDANGCKDSLLSTLTGPLAIDISATTININCFGDSTGKISITNVVNNQGPIVNYDWVFLGGIPEPTDPLATTATGLPAGEYSVIVYDDAGCTNSFDFILTENTQLRDSLNARPAFCRTTSTQNGNGILTVSAFDGVSDYTYLWENDLTGEQETATTWSALEPANYTITITDKVGCILIDHIYLDSVNPEALFTPISLEFEGPGAYEGTEEMEVEFENESINFSDEFYPLSDTTFKWNLFTNKDTDGNWFFSFNYNEKIDTTYTGEEIFEVCLVAKNWNDCVDTLCKELIVHSEPIIVGPNVFTPGEAPNEVYFFPSQGMKDLNCIIYDRYGVKVFEFTTPDDVWDGTHYKSGKECNDGVYFYSYNAESTNGRTFSGEGSVTLIRDK